MNQSLSVQPTSKVEWSLSELGQYISKVRSAGLPVKLVGSSETVGLSVKLAALPIHWRVLH